MALDFGGMIKSAVEKVTSEVIKENITDPYVGAYTSAFMARLPTSIRDKLTDDEISIIIEISMELMHNAAKGAKSKIASLFSGE